MRIFEYLALIAVLLALYSTLSIVWNSWRSGISPLPTSIKAKKALLSVLPPAVEGELYELGAGWGGLALSLAARYPNCTIIAYESSCIPYLFSRLRLFLKPRSNIRFLYGDLFNCDLRNASGIVCYLYPAAMVRLKSKFERELKGDCWVVSNTFALPQWKIARTAEVGDIYQSKIYFYLRSAQGSSASSKR